jgi:hypothetical protein
MSATAHTEDPSDPGAAQFLQNLSEQQLRHLAFAVPQKSAPERYSQFLETPRRTPVPKRFTFDALNAESRKAKKEIVKDDEKKDVGRLRSDSANSVSSIDLLKEVEKVKIAVEVVGGMDWRFYATGGCLCLLNLVAAWDATSLAIVLPVSFNSLPLMARLIVYTDNSVHTWQHCSAVLLACNLVPLGSHCLFSTIFNSLDNLRPQTTTPRCYHVFNIRELYCCHIRKLHRHAHRPNSPRYWRWRHCSLVEPHRFRSCLCG